MTKSSDSPTALPSTGASVPAMTRASAVGQAPFNSAYAMLAMIDADKVREVGRLESLTTPDGFDGAAVLTLADALTLSKSYAAGLRARWPMGQRGPTVPLDLDPGDRARMLDIFCALVTPGHPGAMLDVVERLFNHYTKPGEKIAVSVIEDWVRWLAGYSLAAVWEASERTITGLSPFRPPLGVFIQTVRGVQDALEFDVRILATETNTALPAPQKGA